MYLTAEYILSKLQGQKEYYLLTTFGNITKKILIDAANDYITEHGLRFNPSKTKCMTFGSCNLKEKQWFLIGQALEQENQITHLGVV